jgi:hypothetical protein
MRARVCTDFIALPAGADNDINPQDASAIGGMIHFNKALVTLKLADNLLGSDGADIIIEAIDFNVHLQQLDLRSAPRVCTRIAPCGDD